MLGVVVVDTIKYILRENVVQGEPKTQNVLLEDVIVAPPTRVTPSYSYVFKLALLLIPLFIYGGYHWYQSTQASTTINTTISANDDLNNGLVGHWTFDGPVTNWMTDETFDTSGNELTASILLSGRNAAIPGKIGQALHFLGGVSESVVVPAAAPINDLPQKTVSAWVFLEATSSSFIGLLTKSASNGSQGWSLFLTNGSPRLTWDQEFSSTDGQWRSVNSLPLRKWALITITYDQTSTASVPRMYIDGQLVSTSTVTNPSGSASSDAIYDVNIGSSGNGDSFPGNIDDIRIYNRVLSAPEVKRLYEMGATKHFDTNDTLGSGLVGYWTFDVPNMVWASTTAEVLDTSTSRNNGDATNMNSTAATAGRIGQGLVFDGADDTVDMGDPASGSLDFGTGDIAVSVWIKTNGYANHGSIYNDFVGKNSGGAGWFLGINSTNQVYFSAASAVTGTKRINDNEWHHVVGMRQSGTAKLFLDGVSQPDGSTSANNLNNSYSFRIGNSADGSHLFTGSIDDVRVYNRALSATEVKQLYEKGSVRQINTTITSPDLENGLVGHWTFDGPKMAWGSSTAEVRDSSASNYNGDASGISTSAATPGKMGQALIFDGSSSHINVGTPSNLNNLTNLTISAWIKPRSVGENFVGVIAGKAPRYNPTSGGWVLRMDIGNKLYFATDFSTTDLQLTSNSSEVPLNQWSHVVATWASSTASTSAHIYRNGVEINYGSVVDGVGSHRTDTGSDYFMIGEEPLLAAAFDGLMDDVRIYNRALSASEVKRLYELGGGR